MATGDVISILDSDAVKTEWLVRLGTLVDQVKAWAQASGWRTRRIEKTLTERGLGTYMAPLLLMEKNAVEVVLNPVARFVPGASGAVELYVAPACDDIASLYFETDHWVIHNAIRPAPIAPGHLYEIKPLPYCEESIRNILDSMATNG